MADNDKTKPKEPETLAAAITTDQVRAIVEDVLTRGGYVTAETVTRLMDKQTLTFQATVTGLRDELSEQIRTIRGDFTDEMKHWRSTIRGIDDRAQQLLSQNIEVLKLSANIQGQNAQIAATLDRFSNRLDDIGEDWEAKFKTSLSEFAEIMRRSVTENSERIAKLEKEDARRTNIEKRLKAVPGALWAAVKFVSHPRMLAIIAAVGAATGLSLTAVIEFLKALGGG